MSNWALIRGLGGQVGCADQWIGWGWVGGANPWIGLASGGH